MELASSAGTDDSFDVRLDTRDLRATGKVPHTPQLIKASIQEPRLTGHRNAPLCDQVFQE